MWRDGSRRWGLRVGGVSIAAIALALIVWAAVGAGAPEAPPAPSGQILADDSASIDVSRSPTSETSAGVRAPLAAAVSEGDRSLRGVVVDAEGRPLPALEVNVGRPAVRGASEAFATVSGPAGQVAWDGLAPGTYRATVAGFDVESPQAIVVAPTGDVPFVRIVCRRERVLAGRVLDAGDAPVPGVWVIVEERSGAEVAKVMTGADGAFRVRGATWGQDGADVRLWVYSAGRFATEGKRDAEWGDADLVLRATPAPTGALVVLGLGAQPVHQYRLWVDLDPAVRAAAPWVADGWIAFAPGTSPRLPGLGLVPQRLRIFPADPRFACVVVEVPGGNACREQRVQLAASAELLVRTSPPTGGASVRVLRVPKGVVAKQAWRAERLCTNPLPKDQVVVLGETRTDASGSARVLGGAPGETVTLYVVGGGAAGVSDTVLASSSEVVVPVMATATLDLVVTGPPPGGNSTLALEPVADDGAPDRLGREIGLAFGGGPDITLLAEVTKADPQDPERRRRAVRALFDRDAQAMRELLADPTLSPVLRTRIEALASAVAHRCQLTDLPAGRYRVVPMHPRSLVAFADLTLAPGEHKEHVLDLARLKPELDLRFAKDMRFQFWSLVAEGSGELIPMGTPRPGPTRIVAVAPIDETLWLSRDVADLPAYGPFSWSPDMQPMKATLRLRTSNGVPVAERAVSRVPATDATSGWNGRPLGQTDPRGEVALRGTYVPFKLRVDGVAPLLGPFTLDARRLEQVIEVEVPGG